MALKSMLSLTLSVWHQVDTQGERRLDSMIMESAASRSSTVNGTIPANVMLMAQQRWRYNQHWVGMLQKLAVALM